MHLESRHEADEHDRDASEPERGSAPRQYLGNNVLEGETPRVTAPAPPLSGTLTHDVELRSALRRRRRSPGGSPPPPRGLNGEEWTDKSNYFTVEVWGALPACAQALVRGWRVSVGALRLGVLRPTHSVRTCHTPPLPGKLTPTASQLD